MFNCLNSNHIKPTSKCLKKVFIHDEILPFDDLVHPTATGCQADFSILEFPAVLLQSHEASFEGPLNSH